MKTIAFMIALSAAGCSSLSSRRSGDFDGSLIRRFSSIGIDDEICLSLKGDHTYVQYPGGLLNSDTEAKRIAMGTKGHWERRDDKVWLFPERGAVSKLKITQKNGVTILEIFPGPGFPYK
jgi:hypothetical protein